jgi:CRISPR/Cas system-associated exonuclease Cas4 (RecB family)
MEKFKEANALYDERNALFAKAQADLIELRSSLESRNDPRVQQLLTDEDKRYMKATYSYKPGKEIRAQVAEQDNFEIDLKVQAVNDALAAYKEAKTNSSAAYAQSMTIEGAKLYSQRKQEQTEAYNVLEKINTALQPDETMPEDLKAKVLAELKKTK